nr:hypothetical protein [Vibrio rotiferianus]
MIFVFKVVCSGFGIALAHPLAGRYVNTLNSEQLRENNNDRFYSW